MCERANGPQGTGFFLRLPATPTRTTRINNQDVEYYTVFVSCKHVFIGYSEPTSENWNNNVPPTEKYYVYLHQNGTPNSSKPTPTSGKQRWDLNFETAIFPDDQTVDLIVFPLVVATNGTPSPPSSK